MAPASSFKEVPPGRIASSRCWVPGSRSASGSSAMLCNGQRMGMMDVDAATCAPGSLSSLLRSEASLLLSSATMVLLPGNEAQRGAGHPMWPEQKGDGRVDLTTHDWYQHYHRAAADVLSTTHAMSSLADSLLLPHVQLPAAHDPMERNLHERIEQVTQL